MLLRAGANPFTVDKRGFDAIDYSAKYGHVDVVKTFLKGRTAADINQVTSRVLMTAAANSKLELVKYLLQGGADPVGAGASGFTALHVTEDLAVFKELLQGHEKQTAAYVSTAGNTLLHWVVKEKRGGGFICALYKAGVDPTVKNKYGSTAADLAAQLSQPEVAKLLHLLEAKYRATQSGASIGVASRDSALEKEQKSEDSARSNTSDRVTAPITASNSNTMEKGEDFARSRSRNEVVKEHAEPKKSTEAAQSVSRCQPVHQSKALMSTDRVVTEPVERKKGAYCRS